MARLTTISEEKSGRSVLCGVAASFKDAADFLASANVFLSQTILAFGDLSYRSSPLNLASQCNLRGHYSIRAERIQLHSTMRPKYVRMLYAARKKFNA
jgi:hypothetical protein